jgi:hypothetical protein
MLKTNLQLFADDEVDEIDEIDLETEDIEDESTEETKGDVTEVDTEDESKDNEPVKPKQDKVTTAIIREKQQNKILRDKLAAAEKREAERERNDRDRQLKQRLIDEGYTEQEAADKVSDRREREELASEVKRLKYNQQADKLSQRYPDIHDHLDSFIGIVESSKGAITLAELCKAKLDESTTAETRTKIEQELLLNKQKAKSKQITEGENKAVQSVKLSPDDEEAYKFYAARNPGKSKKDYFEIIKAKKGWE